MRVVADELDCQMIELQDKDGVARGGIIFQLSRATVHLLAAIDPKNEPFSKRRGREEMEGAVAAALDYEHRVSAALKFYGERYYLYLLVGFVALLFWSIGSSNYLFVRWLH